WTNMNDVVAWNAMVEQPGRYTVEVSYACEPNSAGAGYEVVAGDEGEKGTARGTIHSTGNWETFTSETLGQVELPAGKQTVRVRALTKPGVGVMNLRQVRLVPVR